MEFASAVSGKLRHGTMDDCKRLHELVELEHHCIQELEELSYMLLALTFTVAQAVAYGFTGTPLSYARRSNPGPRYGIAGRPEYTETFQRETGNFYGGQRDGQFIVRDGRDNVRGLQYSSRPGSEWSSSPRGYYGSPYNQQYGTQDGLRREGYGYAAGRGQISFNAPLANTRSYNPQFDSYRSY